MTAASPMSQIILHSSINWIPTEKLGNICGALLSFLDPTMRYILYTADKNKVVLMCIDVVLMNFLPVGSACHHCQLAVSIVTIT